MSQIVCILGRQPALGMAELESLYGPKSIQPIGSAAAIVDAELDFPRLGGTVKAAKLLTTLNTSELPAIIKHLGDTLPQHFQHIPAGKITIGLSFYGFPLSHGKINAYALTLKKNLKSAQRGVRLVPNKAPDLNTAQVIHNRLTGPNGMEIVLVKWGKRTVVAQTTAVQDIEAYAARDQARPARDAKVGMLPPKLAQIIVNLAVSDRTRLRVLDPFCGTGVVLQEAALMNFSTYGTDLDERMVRYSRDNLNWLEETRNSSYEWYLEVGDATSHVWQQPVDAIACETYLGRPFSAEPRPDVLQQVMQDVDTIHRKFLQNVAQQTAPGFRMTIAVPAWKTRSGFKHLKTLDSLEELGYNRVSFVHSDTRELIYHRENQVVARELVTLIRK